MSFRFTNDKKAKLAELSKITVGEFDAEDANKVLAVAADGANIVLADIPAPPSELPSAGAAEDGYVLKWDWTPDADDPTIGSGAWVVGPDATGGGGVTTFAALTDTDITDIGAGKLLSYDGTSSTWQAVQSISLANLPLQDAAGTDLGADSDGKRLVFYWDGAANDGAGAGSWNLAEAPQNFGSGLDGSVLTWNGSGAAFTELNVPFSAFESQGVVQNGWALTWVWDEAAATGTWQATDVTAGFVEATEIVVTSDGAGAFEIDGVLRDSISLLPGLIYKFDQSDLTNQNHPIAFSTGPDGAGSQWLSGVQTVGIAGESGAYTTLKVSATTPATLYYYCQNHPGMGGQADVFSGGAGGSDVDPRYVCDPATGIQEIDFAMGATDIDMNTAVWVKVKGVNSGGVGSTQTLIIPNIDDADNPAGRRLIISDMNDLPEEDAVQVTIASGGGATAGQIDGAAFEEIFDYASLSIVCTGQRVVEGDPSSGLFWKII